MRDQQFDEDIDFGELLLTVLGEWRIVAVALVASLAMAATYAFAIAPTQYSAVARVTGNLQAYCPESETCKVSLSDAFLRAAARVETPTGFGILDEAVDLSGDEEFASGGDFSVQTTQRAFFRATRVDVDTTSASVSVAHASDRRAVELANAIAGFIIAELESQASENDRTLARNLELRLAALPSTTQIASQPDSLIALERSALSARVEALADHVNAAVPVAVLDVPAALPLELRSPRRALLLVTGAMLGALLGIGAALVTAKRRGRLYGRGPIAGAFGDQLGELVTAAAFGPDDLRRVTFWQDVRVSLGAFEGGAITLTGVGSDATMMRAAQNLAAEFARSGLKVAILDLADRKGLASAVADGGVPMSSCTVKQLPESCADLVASGDVVIIVPPPITRDLPAVREAMARSQARVILVPMGVITQHDVARLVLAARGAPGPQVVALTDARGRHL